VSERDDGDGGPGPRKTGEDAALEARLKALADRLDQHRVAAEPEPARGGGFGPGMAQALRLAAEFVAGILVGAALGWGFDSLFNTSPWGLIGFVLLGFAAGALNALRSAGLVQEREGIVGRKPDGRD
jgi:ATP synthase protein I